MVKYQPINYFLINRFSLWFCVIVNSPESWSDAWLAIFVAMLVGLIFAIIYVLLAQRFPGKNYPRDNDVVFGPYGKNNFSSLPLVFLPFGRYVRHFGDFLAGIIFPRPLFLFLIVITLILHLLCQWY